MNKDIIEKIKSTNSVSELKELANKNGYSLNDVEAKKYFELFHNNGKVNEQELLNISGGKCEDPFKWCRGASRYSSDTPHNLIVTLFNSCSLFERKSDDLTGKNCANCKYIENGGFTKYCTKRTFYNDELNPA